MRMPQIIRAETDADFIAMVPALLGMRPTRSLVLVMFEGSRSAGGARVDLPAGRSTRELRSLADLCVNIASRSRGIDRVATVVYSDTTFEHERGIPWVDLSRAIEQRMQRAGFGITAQLCVAPDGWGNARATGADRGPRPLAEIELSPSVERVSGIPVDDPQTWGTLPEPEPWLDEQIDEYLELNSAHWSDPTSRDDGWPDVISPGDAESLHNLIELIVSRPAKAMGALEIATLAAYASLPSWRDTLMLQMAFGRRIGQRAADSHRFWNAERQRRGGTMDEVVAASRLTGDACTDLEESVLAGLITGESAVRPSLDRCTNAIAALLRAAANVDLDLRAGLLCMAAWLNWAIGRSSAAHALIAQGVLVDPSHRMMQIVEVLVDSGRVPEWMFSRHEDERESSAGVDGWVDDEFNPASPHQLW